MSAASFVSTGKKIVAIGRNYMNHVKELKNTAPREPFFFLKPTTSYLASGGNFEIPRGVLVHHEVELGVVIGKRCKDIQQSQAFKHIAGYALAIDMTARNMQDVVKKQGLPWSAVKGFDTFTPIGKFIPSSSVTNPHDLRIWLKINGEFKQNGSTSDMLFRIPRLIEHVSSIMTLEEGDLLLTGTPEGVGPVSPNDEILAGLNDPQGNPLDEIIFNAVERRIGYEFKI